MFLNCEDGADYSLGDFFVVVYLFLIGGRLLYNVVLVSAGQ